MGQVVSDVTEVLDYKKAKKEAKSERKKILEQMAADEQAKKQFGKKRPWHPSELSTVRPECLVRAGE